MGISDGYAKNISCLGGYRMGWRLRSKVRRASGVAALLDLYRDGGPTLIEQLLGHLEHGNLHTFVGVARQSAKPTV